MHTGLLEWPADTTQYPPAQPRRWRGSKAWKFWGSESLGEPARGLIMSWQFCWWLEHWMSSDLPQVTTVIRNLWSGRELLPVFTSEIISSTTTPVTCACHYRGWHISSRDLQMYELEPTECVQTHTNVWKKIIDSYNILFCDRIHKLDLP